MIRLLTILLLVQLVITVLVYWPAAEGPSRSEALVAGLEPQLIERIQITDGDGTTSTLIREGDAWRLESGLPAAGSKVEVLLSALTGGDPGFAIATSDGAAARFDVAEDDFERRVVLAGGGSEYAVYLGTSPSFRKIHARRDGESAVFVIEFNSYDAPVEDSSWLDRSLLAAEDLSTLALYGIRYRRNGGSWTRDDGEAVEDDAVEALVQALSRLQVSGVTARDGEDARQAGEALRVTLGEGAASSRLTVLDNPDTEHYFLSSDRFDPLFTTSAFDAERLIEAARAAAGLVDEQSGGAAADQDPDTGDTKVLDTPAEDTP